MVHVLAQKGCDMMWPFTYWIVFVPFPLFWSFLQGSCHSLFVGVVATTVAAPFDTLKSCVMVDDGPGPVQPKAVILASQSCLVRSGANKEVLSNIKRFWILVLIVFACQTMNVLEIGCWSVVSLPWLEDTELSGCSAETPQYKLTISSWNIMTYESYEILFDYSVSANRMQPFCIHDCVGLRLRSQGSRFPRGFPDALLSILREEAWATPPVRFKPELPPW